MGAVGTCENLKLMRQEGFDFILTLLAFSYSIPVPKVPKSVTVSHPNNIPLCRTIFEFYTCTSVSFLVHCLWKFFFSLSWDVKRTIGRQTSQNGEGGSVSEILKQTIDNMKAIMPEVEEIFNLRYRMLYLVSYMQPIGRRNLSIKLNITERVIRKEAMELKTTGLIAFTGEGMMITDKGYEILEYFKDYFDDFVGIKALEQRTKEVLGIRDVLLVPSDQDPELVLREIGRTAAAYMLHHLDAIKAIGLTGGSSVYHVVEAMKSLNVKAEYGNVSVVPARGGLGSISEHQANTLAERLARKIGGKYETLYMPDFLSEMSIEVLMNEPAIKKALDRINTIDFLVFGIGMADVMAQRRSLEEPQIASIKDKGAVAEAFGFYFNQEGEIVYEISTIGISLDTFKGLEHLIGVAGGEEKAEAIVSVCRLNRNLILVTDEKAARRIIEEFKEEKK